VWGGGKVGDYIKDLPIAINRSAYLLFIKGQGRGKEKHSACTYYLPYIRSRQLAKGNRTLCTKSKAPSTLWL